MTVPQRPWRRSDFHYGLPPELIAQQPLAERSASRLLDLSAARSEPRLSTVRELPALLRPGDLLVFNDTQVIPARLTGHKPSGGQVEVFVERLIDERSMLAQIRASKAPRVGSELQVAGFRLRVEARPEVLYEVRSLDLPLTELLIRAGQVPLPHYIDRDPTEADRERYQTVYARVPGAVAAPTAGLHFDASLLAAIDVRGVERRTVTLHVGAGTFSPVRVDEVASHQMHAEWLEVSAEVAARVALARAEGRRVVAIGTTTLRALETAAASGQIRAYSGLTRLFIHPGYPFQVTDALFTNFHLPESSLLMLVCALGGHARVMAAYRHAVEQRLRFFSYGDAMWVEPRASPPSAPG